MHAEHPSWVTFCLLLPRYDRHGFLSSPHADLYFLFSKNEFADHN